MPSLITCILMLLVIIVVLAALLYGYGVYKQSYFTRRGIKAPKAQLYWGHLKDIMTKGMYHFDYDCTEKYGLIWGCFLGNHPTIIVNDPEMIREISITRFSKFYDRVEVIEMPTMWKNSLNNAKGSTWKYLRFVLQPSFSSSKLKSMRPIMKKCLDEFISSIDEHLEQTDDQILDMAEIYKRLTMDVISSTAFGIDINSQKNPGDPFVKHVSKVLGASLGSTFFLLNFFFPDFKKIIMRCTSDWIPKDSMDFLKTTVKQAMEVRHQDTDNDYTDLLQIMMNTQSDSKTKGLSTSKTFEQMKEEGMSEDDIVYNGIIFLAAGHETTTSLLTFFTYSLATHMDYQNRLFDEIERNTRNNDGQVSYDSVMKMEFLEMFMQETLRLYPPAARFNREPACDVVVKGMKFEKGCDISFAPNGLHRNPKFWPDPEKFDPERFSAERIDTIIPGSFIPFGMGPRNCVGMKLALMEAKMVIVHLLRHFKVMPSSKLDNPPEISSAGGLLKLKNGLNVKLVRR